MGTSGSSANSSASDTVHHGPQQPAGGGRRPRVTSASIESAALPGMSAKNTLVLTSPRLPGEVRGRRFNLIGMC
jgi:hypothetical protein